MFYAGQRISACTTPEQLREFLRQSDNPVVITTNKCEAALLEAVPGELEELARRRRFLRRGDVVVFTRRGAGPAAETATRPACTVRQ